ncbi:MAG TPA: hypothetical protein PLP27_01220 [Crocinitomicaceae bacterium]|nr:hypothetical protein [Crocinitomicaceae bacterium]
MIPQKNVLIIALLATIVAVGWQELNLFYLNKHFGYTHSLITSNDEASYLVPPHNLLSNGV